MKFQRFLKGQMDFWISLFFLIVLFPVFLIIAFLIKIDSPGPVFFRQKRVGKGGELFRVWKFRTMVKGAENMGLGLEIAKQDPRITKTGRFLRRWVLDELPQLINVIFGQMSLVGPRTALPHQVKKYSLFERQRLKVKPGITNINVGRGWNTLSWQQRIKNDIWYIDNWSLGMDFKIIFKSFLALISGKGQYGEKGIVKDYE